jgi:predicted dienelactone hydrolase
MDVRHISLLIALFAFLAPEAFAVGFYDPLSVSGQAPSQVQALDLAFHDEARDRDLPLRVYLPAAPGPAPVVLFSHGLGGSREGGAYLGRHWAARGYVAVFVQHAGSDDAVWKDKPPLGRMQALREAANAQNFIARVMDVAAVLDQLERWDRADGHALVGRLDLERVGMSGHSFGALTTQTVSGQRFEEGKLSYADARIKAAVMFSPSSPRRGGDERAAFGQVLIPWMLMTGTKDVAPVGDADVASRLAVFPALPPGQKYELVLDGAEHSAFADRSLPGDREQRNPNHHRAILALSTAFWDAFLHSDESARAWLDGDEARSVLERKDRWQRK